MVGCENEEHQRPPPEALPKRKLPFLAGQQSEQERDEVNRLQSETGCAEDRQSIQQPGDDAELDTTLSKPEAHRTDDGEASRPWVSLNSDLSGSIVNDEPTAEVNVDHLLENDVGKALRNTERSSQPTASCDFQSFLTGLGFEVNDVMEVREFTGQRLSVSSNRRDSWVMLERQGSAVQDPTLLDCATKDHEKFLVQEIFGPPTQQYRIQPQHLALTRIMKHIFAMQDDISRASYVSVDNMVSENSENLDRRLVCCPTQICSRSCGTCFRNYVRRPAGLLVKRKWFAVFFTFLTFYALVGMDLYNALGNSDHELAFMVVNTLVFCLFASELLLYSIGLSGYLYTMPFVLDAIAVVSMFGDTWFISGDLFGEETSGVMRMARSSRVARLARLARIARFTRMIPQVMMCRKSSQLRVAKEALLRRLWRIFLFLDNERKGRISSFDFKCVYLILLQNHPALTEQPNRVNCLEEDARWFNSTFSLFEEAWMGWNEFGQKLLMTRLGKMILQEHAKSIDSSEGVWRLTRKIGDRSALKISVIILMLLGALSLFDSDNRDTVASLGIAELDYMARRERARGPLTDPDLCHHIGMFRHRYHLMFLQLDGYVRWEDGLCVDRNVTSASPFQRIDRLIADSKLRSDDYMVVCAPDAEDCAKHQNLSSVGLIDDSSYSRQSAWLVLLSTVLVIVLLLMFISTMNAKMGTFTKALLTPLCSLLDDMNVLSVLELAHVDEDMPSTGVHPARIARELVEVQDSFRSLRSAIRSWSKYVPPMVVQRLFSAGLEAQIGVSEITATILFCDLLGFEEACLGLTPKEVLLVLATALGTISEVIDRYRGTLLEFIGDEVLAVFNAPNKVKHHTYAGTMTALDIHVAISELPPFVSMDGQAISVRCRCGVHTAAILAGNIGSHQRMKYGLLGDGINLTARLKTLNSRYNTQTLVSDKVIADDYCMRRVRARPVDIVAVKGKKKPTVVYEAITPDSPEMLKAIEQHRKAFSLYQERSFAEAEAMFDDVGKAFGEFDGPSSLLKRRCARYAKEPPPPDWDGVERLNAKSFQPG